MASNDVVRHMYSISFLVPSSLVPSVVFQAYVGGGGGGAAPGYASGGLAACAGYCACAAYCACACSAAACSAFFDLIIEMIMYAIAPTTMAIPMASRSQAHHGQ